MKDDAPLPAAVPRKRRQIEALLDRHIAIWLADPDLPRGDRKRLEGEKARRKQAVPDQAYGLLVGPGGVTPQQLAELPDALAGATMVHHPGTAGKVHSACKSVAPVTIHRDDLRAVVRASSVLVAVPSVADPQAKTPVWDSVRYAKHRSLEVKIILPNGTYQGAAA